TPDPMPHVHDSAPATDSAGAIDLARLDEVVAHSQHASLAFPALVLAPGAALFGPPSADWTLTSVAQDRTRGMTMTFDARSGQQLSREAFADRHPVDRVIGIGQAWHEGALLGVFNQAIGVLTALALATMSITGFLMWRRRRPPHRLGAPPLPAAGRKPALLIVAVILLVALLPLLAVSLLVLWLVDRLLPRISPAAAQWLGLQRSPS